MTTAQPFDATSDAVRRIESAWADIADRHPDVERDVVFVVKSDRRAWGHMTLGRTWAEDLPEGHHGPLRYWREIMLSAELLAQHPVRILQTMIHEAAHTVAQTRRVKDTSRQNRYHNGTFREIAEEMGLEWTHVVPESVRIDGERIPITFDDGEVFHDDGTGPVLPTEAPPDSTTGFSDMHITRRTAEDYADTVATLDGISIKHHADRRRAAAPRKRRTVHLVPHRTTLCLADRFEAEDAVGHSLTPGDDGFDPVQRIGVQVYEGLAARNLLTNHVYWIEE